MNITATNNWLEANQCYLMASIGVVRERLEHLARQAQNQSSQEVSEGSGEEILDAHSPSKADQALEAATAALPTPSALDQLCHTFNLSPFERDVLLLCIGMELDSSFPSLCAKAQNDSQRAYPTFSLALTALPNPHWNALTPAAPLRHWQLIEVGTGAVALTLSPLRVDERILHFLTGVPYVDERLAGMIESMPLSFGTLVESHQQLAEQLSGTWLHASGATLPIIQLYGDDSANKRAIATAACGHLGLGLHTFSAEALPIDTTQLNLVRCLCEREFALSNTAILLDCDEAQTAEAGRERAISYLTETLNCPIIVSSRDRRRQKQRPLVTFEVHHPTPREQRLLWEDALGEMNSTVNGHVDSLIAHFSLNAPAIQAACLQVKSLKRTPQETSPLPTIHSLFPQLWDICRTYARPRLDELAQRIDSSVSWQDLILPEKERQILRDIAAHVRQRANVYESWGFAGKSGRGLGISALFAGASGTGKTLAAEVLANELKLDVYRIDLSSVVSKYIGETEKNLRRIFDAGEGGGAILLFDEADSLFGKRSDVKDSHDRYANMEVSYLLQRMEAYRGLAVLTTNLKGSIDQAFLRRIRFIVQFPFPDASQRAEIWQHVFPKQTPTEGLDFNKLAKLNVAGGNIRNIALNAAFIASDAHESVGMKHILQAAKSEYMKLERPLTDTEVKGWV